MKDRIKYKLVLMDLLEIRFLYEEHMITSYPDFDEYENNIEEISFLDYWRFHRENLI
jgi:hypothetical protein